MTELAPILRGTLGNRPFVQMLIRLADARFTGTLVLEGRRLEESGASAPNPESGSARSAVYFERGQAGKAKCGAGVHFLGDVLMSQGHIEPAVHFAALEQSTAERRLYGEVLLRQGKISDAMLHDALTEQLARKVEWMFGLPPETLYGLYEHHNLLERWGGPESTPVGTLPLLWRLVRNYAGEATIQAGLARIGDRILKLHPASQVARFRFDRREQSLVDVLRAKPISASALLQTGLVDEALSGKIIYVLALTRQLDMGRADQVPVGTVWAGPHGADAMASRLATGDVPASRERLAVVEEIAPGKFSSEPPTTSGGRFRTDAARTLPGERRSAAGQVDKQAAGSASPATPRGVGQADGAMEGPEGERQRLEIEAYLTRIDQQDYYEILGVERQAPTVAIQAAFLQLAKKWHPDRLAPELESSRAHVTRAFARISEARGVLTDAEGRRQYDDLLRGGGGKSGEQEEVARVLRAAAAFQRAEVLLKKGNLPQAETEAHLAYEGDPQQADHLGLYAWILAQQPARAASGKFADVIALLDRAAELEPENIRVRYYRGQVYKRAGNVNKAIKEFRFVVERKPNHVDAAREVRLYEIRRSERSSVFPESGKRVSERPPVASAAGGFLGRLFKR